MNLQALPNAPEAEQGLLSCFLSTQSLLDDAAACVPPEWLYSPSRRLLYIEMLELHGAGHPVEYIAISQHLQDKGLMDKIGGQGTLAELLDFVPSPAHYGYYKSLLKDKATLRSLIAVLEESRVSCDGHHEDVPGLLASVTEKFFTLSKQQDSKDRKEFKDIIAQYVDTWEDRMMGRIPTGIPTRWPAFNSTFGGITPRLWLIAGFPSDGKSALLQNMVEDSLSHGKHVLWFSYEMDETEIVDRLMTAKTGLDSQNVFFPQNGVSRDATTKITRAVGELQKLPLHLRCEATWTADQIVSEARRMMLKYPIGLVAIDYLQLVPNDKKFNTRADEVAYMSRAFKLGSASLQIPFIILSQLNDDGKTKESRAPNQDASNILFIESPPPTADRKGNLVESKKGLRVVKNRNGKRGDLLPIRLCGPTFSFVQESSV